MRENCSIYTTGFVLKLMKVSLNFETQYFWASDILHRTEHDLECVKISVTKIQMYTIIVNSSIYKPLLSVSFAYTAAFDLRKMRG